MPLPKMVPEVKARWVSALRSGKYEQTNGLLRRGPETGEEFGQDTYGYCCLGVLCDVYAQDHPEWDWRKNADRGSHPQVVADWSGLSTAETIEENTVLDKLIDLNDTYKWSFKRIAAYVERWL